MITADPQLRILRVNSALSQLLGYSDSELLNMTLKDITHPDDLPSTDEATAKFQKNSRALISVEKRYIHKNGSDIWVKVSAFGYVLNSAKQKCPVAVVEDLTALKEAESAKDSARRKLRVAQGRLETKDSEYRARIHALFTQSADPIMTLAPPTWRFTNCNPAAMRLFEVQSEAEFTNLGPWDLSPEMQPDGRRSSDKAPEMITLAMKFGSHFFEWDHKTTHGEVINCTVLLSRVEIGGERYLQATVRDITQTIAQEKRWLTEQENSRLRSIKDTERFKLLFDASPNPILVFSNKGILDCNLAAIEILAAPCKEAILSCHPAKFSPELQSDGRSSAEKSIEMDRIARARGKHRFEWTHQTLDGVLFPVEVTLSPIEWFGESALLVMWNDLTERKRQQIQLIQSSKMASLGEMSAGIAHEINNPLAIISSSVELLSKFHNNPEKLGAKIKTIEKACSRIARIVGGLKKFSRSGNRADYKRHDLLKIIDEASILTEAKAKRHSTPVTIHGKSNARILCDEVEIEQVVVNLINNAIDAVKDLPERWVKVSLFGDAKSVVLRVTDSGSGIPEQVRAKLFEPFFTTKRVGEGTGLVLSITKGILEEHQATIVIQTNSPSTCFEIRFPRAEDIKNAA